MKTTSTNVTKINIEAKPGLVLTDCLDELVMIAILNNCEAVLSHNDRKYTATATKIFATIVTT